ncbi:EAL domain-containing protein [Nitrincola sp.]|uniref:EAL domain-containing response regulator n=1 Tax=Nitrincola sp. TaxID=1926584 RepID=UPI003A91ADFF
MSDQLFEFLDDIDADNCTSQLSDVSVEDPPKYHSLKLLVVDDDEDVHLMTELLLKGLSFDEGQLLVQHAYNSQEAYDILLRDPDIAVVLLDVVMESEDAGLQLVHRIRHSLRRTKLRIILRTGQPGYAPELETIQRYDINDYKTKTELTRERLYTCLMTAARSYRQLDQLEKLAYEDHLTGLLNRNGLLRALEIKAQSSTEGYTLVLLDIDNFSMINDTFGAYFADRFLIDFAALLKHLPMTEGIARLSADQFGLLIGTTGSLVEEIVRSQLVSRSLAIEGVETALSFCMGIAYHHKELTPSEMLGHATLALKRAKKVGIGQTVIFSDAMICSLRERVSMLSSLKQDLDRHRLYLVYQPQIQLQSGRLIGVEALVRWMDESGQMISPAVFIELAEQSGLIVKLGEWVLRRALFDCADLCRTRPGFRVAVNVSPLQFQQLDFVEQVKACLHEQGLEGQHLDLEITESVSMSYAEETIQKFNALRAMGVTISIDDFGTGFSSLSYLERLHVDCLKIDRSFVDKLTTSTSGYRIAQTILTLGQRLNMRVLAEGIETDAQLNELIKLNCDEGQGYLIARPMKMDALQEWIDDHAVQPGL